MTIANDVSMVVVVALQAEAQPLVESLGLKANAQSQPFRSYRRDNCHLVVSGIGKVRAAAASGWIGARVGAADQREFATPVCWVNAGICGHASAVAGTVVRASVICDPAVEARYYPPNVVSSGLAGAEVITVDRPEREFSRDCAYDMEASAFWQTATRFSTAELCAVIKVVSDGPGSELESLDRARIAQLSAELVVPLNESLQGLSALAQTITPAPQIEQVYCRLNAKQHYTVTRQRQLRAALSALYALGRLPALDDARLVEHRDAAAVLAELDARIDQAAVTLEPVAGAANRCHD